MPKRKHTTQVSLELYYAGYEDVREYLARGIEVSEGEYWLPPTLERLIDSCGDHFGSLQRKIDRHAWTVTPKNGHKDYVTYGPNAWEATSNFWLGLKYAQIL